MEQEQNEEGEFEGLELEEEPEIKVEEDTEEEMQGDASSEEACRKSGRFDGEKPHAEPEEIGRIYRNHSYSDNADSLLEIHGR